MEIRLIVLRSPGMERLASFYSLIGVYFEYHRHGNSLMHYSGMIGATTLEIYPLMKNQAEADKGLRLGFALEKFDEIIEGLQEAGVVFLSEPATTDFGYMAVVTDPDGRKVELYKQ